MSSLSESLLPRGICVLERGWLSSNSVVVTGTAGAAVVDTGYWTHAEQTVALVSSAVRDAPVTTIVNTHLHSDHCGGNAALQSWAPQARTFIPPGLAAAVRAWDPVALTYEPTGQHCPPFRADGTLEPGTRVRLGDVKWEVHAAPGHDPHSVILFEPIYRTLISADALWENGFGIVFPELEGERAFEEVAATLDVIERLEPVVVIPGHGSVFSDVTAALSRARSRLDAYEAKPDRHAAHAAKVLLKFKLLEVQRIARADFLAWAGATQYLQLVHQRWFSDVSAEAWISGLVSELCNSGVMKLEGRDLVNA